MTTEKLTKENLPVFLSAFLEKNTVSTSKVAKSIGCTAPTLNRIIAGESFATNELLKQCGILFEIGFERFDKLSSAEKEKISESIGTVGAAGVGFASISSAISVMGTAGLSAVGITSGLSALGALVGGGMIAGVAVAASIPIAAGALGYGLMKGIKSVFSDIQVSNENFDSKWEQKVVSMTVEDTK